MRRAHLAISLALLLAACGDKADPIGKGGGTGGGTDADDSGDVDDTDADTDSGTDSETDTEPVDSDGDGTHDGADCAPEDPDIHPGADDIPYDGIDQDCDGLDLTDFDEDGYDAEIVGGSDCNDEDPSVNPGAIDEENDQDDDCDGEVDEDVPIIPTDWPIRFGGSGASTTADRVANADDGTLWVMGTFDGLVDFEPTYERSETIENEGGTTDIYVVSVDGDRVLGMTLVLASDSTGSLETGGLDVDPGNSLTVTGTFTGSVDLDGSAREYTRESQGDTDGLIGRYNDVGDLSWASSFGGTGADRVVGAVSRPLGGVFLAGEVAGDASYYGAGSATTGQGMEVVLASTGSGDTDGVLVRYDLSGTPEWISMLTASTTGEWVSPSDVVDGDHVIIVAGTFSGTMDLDPSAEGESLATAAGNADVFVVALNAETGGLEWSAVLPCSGEATAGRISIDGSGNVLIVGGFSGTIDLDPGSGDTADAAVGGTDGFAVQLDSSGGRTWSTVIGGSGDDLLTSGDLVSTGGATLVGAISGTTSVGGTTLVSAGGTDCLAMTVDSGGSVGWARAFGSADDEVCSSTSASSDGYAYFSGPITRAFDFSTSGVDDLRRSAGGADGWVHRLPISP
jgi:hypothetical protein